MALCATTALAGAVPRLCVRGARGRFGGFGPAPGVVSLSFPPPRPACSALRVAGRPVRVSLTLARWYAIPSFGRHALWGLRAAGRVCGVHLLGGGLGGGGACAVPPGCAAGAGPVGRGVALPHSVPLPSLGRQQSRRHWRCAVHGGRGPPYHSGSCSPGFSGYDLCGVPVRRRGLACSSRPPWEPAAGAGGRVALRLLSRAGGGHPPCLRGWWPGPPRLAGRWGGGGGGVAPRPPCSPSGRRPAVLHPGPLRVAGALPSGVRVRSGPKCRPGVGGGEGRPVDSSPGGPSRPEPPLCHP